MTNWQEVRLGDVCIQITDGTHNTVKDCESGDCYLLSCKNIKNGNIEIGKNERKIDRHTLEKLRKRTKTAKGDVLLSSVGTIGETAVIKLENPNYEFQRSVAIFKPNLNFITSEFLYYSLNSRKDILQHSAEGAVQQCLFITPLKDFPISLPPIDVQKKIAGVLGALDDKIELNNKINQNLEAQAQALLKSWFIDFDLFGGKTPEDWKKICLSDIAIFVGGYSYKGSELQSSSIAMATIKNFDRQGGFKLDGFKEIVPSSKLKVTQHVDLFDTLVAHTDLTQNAEVIGNAEMLLSTAGYSDIIISMDVVKVLPQKGISKFLLAALLKDNRFKQHCLGYINGTTVLHLSKKALPEYTFVFPDNVNDVNKLTQILEYLYKRIALNIEENERLSQLRDTLLPKLMKGEIDVDDVKID